VILTNEEKMIVTPTYHVMEMYSVHHDALMLPVTVTSYDYVLGEKKLKAISASASKDKNGGIHVSLVNIDAKKEHQITVDLGSISAQSVTGRILQSEKLQDHNTFANPENVKPVAFEGATVNGKILKTKLPPFSVVVLTLQ
jgi:alpha-N-arabinofuranosidase